MTRPPVPVGPFGEGVDVDVVVEEELPSEDVGHVFAGDDQRKRDVPEPVGALVGVVL
jgi:hypothetical protein